MHFPAAGIVAESPERGGLRVAGLEADSPPGRPSPHLSHCRAQNELFRNLLILLNELLCIVKRCQNEMFRFFYPWAKIRTHRRKISIGIQRSN